MLAHTKQGAVRMQQQRDARLSWRARRAIVVAGVTTMVLLATNQRSSAATPELQQHPTCAPDDSVAAGMREHLEWWLTDTASSLATFRIEAGLVGAAPSNIIAVTDTLTCSRARARLYEGASSGIPSTPVSVLRITSSRFAVGDIATRSSAGKFALTDSSFRIIGFIPY